jgi:subtilisin-like proprotein convertase family protein
VKSQIVLFLFFLTISFSVKAQDLWTFEKDTQGFSKGIGFDSNNYIHTVSLDRDQLDAFISKIDSPSSFSKTKRTTIVFPNESGKSEKFSVREVSLLSSELSKEHPNIKTFVGTSLSRKNVHARWSISPLGVNAMIDSPEGQFFLQPDRSGDKNRHLFYKRNGTLYDDFEPLNCLVSSGKKAENSKVQGIIQSKQAAKLSSDQTLKTYRIAVSATGEFTQFWGDDDDTNGTNKEDAYAKIISTINRINQIFQIDLGVQLQLVSDVNLLYDDPDTDPYGNDFNEEIQEILTDSIGEANYDIGHLFDFGTPDGNAGTVGNVCRDRFKGSAYTSHPFVDTSGTGAFLNDYFDIDFVAHEIGHQFGGYHTYSHQTESAGVNSEPGSGSTIMAYAGVTEDDNIQNHSDPYFHYYSIKNIRDYLARNSCQATSSIVNQPPQVSAGQEVNIPKGTAYILEAIASDPDDDSLTYCWEQLNSGLVTRENFGPYNQSGSSNRSFSPTNSPIRTVPSMSRVLTNQLVQTNPQFPNDWQTVSLNSRRLLWGVTVRDRSETSSTSVGQTDQDSRIINVLERAGPFEITSPATNTIIWQTGANEVILWDVANTDQAPINTETVSIYLSSDNGQNFDTLLASNTPNDGRFDLVVPANINSSNVRIKIVPDNGIYFAVNNYRFSILERPFATPFQELSKKACDNEPISFDFTLNRYQEFEGDVDLTLTNVPTGIVYSINMVSSTTDQQQGTISLTKASNISPGVYTMTLVSSSGSTEAQQTFQYIHQQSAVQTPVELSPNASDGVQSIKPLFSWSPDENVDQFIVELSLSNTFDSIVVSTTTKASNFVPLENLPSETTFYWRVKGTNGCGESNYSEVQNFITDLLDCSPIDAVNLPINLIDASFVQSGISFADVYMANDSVISDVNIEVSIQHTYLSDMILSLLAPDGTEVILARNIGGASSNFVNTVFDQEATNLTENGSAPFTGSFLPTEDLSVFNGQSSLGLWRLKVEDVGAQDTGRIILFNINFCVNGAILENDDPDLIPNVTDNCPLIANQDQADADADGRGDLCDVDTFNNFILSKIDETCVSRNNGAIQIRATAFADYTVQVTGPNGFSNGYTFTTNTLSILNLQSGDYLLCIGVADDPSFERCFIASIEEPEPLQVTSFVNENDLSLSLSLNGASSYKVTVNNQETSIQSKSQINLPLRKGLNTIEVTTDLSCQGSFKKEIYIAMDSVLYPNPVQEQAYVLIGGTASTIQYIIYDIQANILLDKKVQLEGSDRKVPIDMSLLPSGNYLLKIRSTQNEETIKFIKQ